MCVVELLFQSICKFRRSITQFTLGSSLSKLKGEKLSLLQKKILTLSMKWADSPNQLHPQRTAERPVWAHWEPELSLCPAASLTPLGLTSTPWQVILASSPGLTTPFSWNNITGLRHLDFVSIFWKLTSSWFTCFLNYIFPMHPGGTAQSFPANLGSFLLFLELPCRSSSPHILLLTFCSHWLVIFISFWKPHNLPVKSYVHSIAPGQLPHLPSLLCRPPLKRNETLQPMSAGLPSQSIPSRKTATDTFLKVPSIAC